VNGAAVIEYETGLFARGGAQATPERLQPANFALCGPGVDNAANITVEARHQNAHTNDDFRCTCFKAVNDGLTLIHWSVCGHNLSVNTRLVKLDCQEIGVGYVDAECDCRQVTAILQPVLYDVAHQRRAAHDFSQLRFVVIAAVLK